MSVENLKIIPAGKEHVKALAIIHVNSWKAAHKNIVPDETLNSMTVQKRINVFSEALKDKNIYLAIQDNAPAGFITVDRARDPDLTNAGEIWGIHLDPKFWRKKIGTELLNWGLDYLTKKNYDKIVLWVFEDNYRARKFYESKGFILEGSANLMEKYNNAKALRYIKKIS
ncbi:MAG TPA: GNAT family N-acetyltransferase [Victivallales bacterium]|nr:GNAT family N-acetyltransferase [Victivallales bacterium]